MDWNDYPGEVRQPNKVYTDTKIASWTVDNENNPTELFPQSYKQYAEKERIISAENSNRYNITQTIAENFEVFCIYEYKCDLRGQFIKTYTDENENVWTGRKVVFYNRAIKRNNPLIFTYEKNLESISRTSDTTDLYTKLYVPPIDDTIMDGGQISIAETDMNPLYDDFILNFDYLYDIGSITEYQKDYIKTYKLQLRTLNRAIKEKSNELSSLQVKANKLNARLTVVTNELAIAREDLEENQTIFASLPQSEAITRDENRPVSSTFFSSSNSENNVIAKVGLPGVTPNSVQGFIKIINNGITEKKWVLTSLTTRPDEPENINEGEYYGILNDQGTLDYIATNKSTVTNWDDRYNSSLIHLTLVYNEYSYYEDIIASLNNIIGIKTTEAEGLQKEKNDYDVEIAKIENDIARKKKEQEELNLKFERVMGSALREGYWNATELKGAYKNIDTTKNVVLTLADPETEEVGYKYSSIEDHAAKKPTYYPYIPLTEIPQGNFYQEIEGKEYKLKDLVISLGAAATYILFDDDTLKIGNYFVTVDNKNYYFKLDKDYTAGTFNLFWKANTPELEFIKENEKEIIELHNVLSGEENSSSYQDITNLFEGIRNKLISLELYNNAGFVFAYIVKHEDASENTTETTIQEWIEINNTKVIPVLLLHNDKLNYTDYEYISYGYSNLDKNSFIYLKDTKMVVPEKSEEGYDVYYPRIILEEANINYESTDTFSISSNSILLERNYEYSVVRNVEKDWVQVNLKISNINTFETYKNSYNLKYQVSYANEQLYEEAYEVALENSKPRFSYDVSISNIPNQIKNIELGQLARINDRLLGAHHMQGYVSGITYKLDQPKSDSLTLQNYKTKFEDLFGVITASSEAMRNNQRSYDAAASSFTSKGTLTKDVLQSSIDANDIAFNFSTTQVQIDDDEGILLTNRTAYSNGVYGQVALRGGGIFLSNNVDTAGNRIWNTGITPNGINASMITAGQLDTNLIRIFSGSDMAFQWNAEGLYAYKKDGENYDENNFICYSGEGLHYKKDGEDVLSLDWENGLLINSGSGTTQLNGELGLVIYDGDKTPIQDGYNWLVRIGRFREEEEEESEENPNPKVIAGMRLYQAGEADQPYEVTLDATNNGKLWLRNTLTIGGNNMDAATVGISGLKDYAFWAGHQSGDIGSSLFYVKHDGTLKATQGFIGPWQLNENYLAAYKEQNSNNLEPVFGLHFGGAKGYDNSSIRFFAGGESGNRNFYITENGGALLTSARIGGNDSQASQIIIEESEDNPKVTNIQSSNFSSDFSGWQITSEGNAEFENVKVRGEISSVIFKYEEYSAIGGSLYLSPSVLLDKIEVVSEGSSKGIFKLEVGKSHALYNDNWSTGARVLINGIYYLNGAETPLKGEAEIINVVISESNSEEKTKELTFQIEKFEQEVEILNVSLVRVGADNYNEYILLDTTDVNGPFIDIQDTDQEEAEQKPKVRLGKLKGINDNSFQNISGYGLYSQNAYLTGQLVLPNAGMTNQNNVSYLSIEKNEEGKFIYTEPETKIETGEIISDGFVRIWAGGSSPVVGEEAAPFIVTQDGTLYASKGIFSGELQTAGIIVETDNTFDQAKHKRFYIAKEHKDPIELKDYILNMDANGLSIFDGSIAAYSDSSNEIYGTTNKYLEPDPNKENQVGIENIIPYFYTYDDWEAEKCDSRWVAKAGHIFDCEKIENKYDITSILFKKGIHFYNDTITSIDNYKQVEKDIYDGAATASFTLLPNCLNYTGTKLGIKMSKEDTLLADTNIRGTVGIKGIPIGRNGIIISPVVIGEENCGIDIISVF